MNIMTWFWTPNGTLCSALWNLCSIFINTPTLVILYGTLHLDIEPLRAASGEIFASSRRRGKEIHLLLLTRCEYLFCRSQTYIELT